MEKPAVKMRSSIACARCRRSKVKCLNNGVNTPCRACEASGRECTYPLPAVPGSANQLQPGPTGAGNFSTQNGLITHASVNGSHSSLGGGGGGGLHERSRSRPKKLATVLQSQHLASGQALLPRDGSQRPISEALDSNILTPTIWSGIYDLLTMHYPHLPILHRPTFLRPLTEAPSADTDVPMASTPPANSTSATPPPLPSPFLLLAVLTLTARFSTPLIKYHNTSEINTSEYYATALKTRLMVLNSGAIDSDDDGFLSPTIPKVQSLIMLAVHELGQSQGQRAWQWLGIAVRMCQLLNLPPQESNLSSGWIAEESERRTWWAVVMLDRMLSNTGDSTGRAFAYGWERVRDVPLPCSERAWLFGERVKVGILDTPIYANQPAISETSIVTQKPLKNGLSLEANIDEENDIPEETGTEESVHARLIRLVDIWGRVTQFLCSPITSSSSLDTLCQELERWKSELPRSLAYSHKNLLAHIAERSSSSYALLHIIYFLSILLLHRESLPVLPATNPNAPPNKCFSAARKITEIAREMHTWLSLPLTPIICFAIYCTAWVGIYGLHYPLMTGPPGNGMGSGDARFLLCMIEGWRNRWKVAEGWVRALGSVHSFLRRKRKASEIADMATSRKRRRSTTSDDLMTTEPRMSSPVTDDHPSQNVEEMKMFHKTISDFLMLSIGASNNASIVQDGSFRQSKRSRSHLASSSTGGNSDTEMGNTAPTSVPLYMTSQNADRDSLTSVKADTPPAGDKWVAVNSRPLQDQNRGLHGLIAAAQADEVSREASDIRSTAVSFAISNPPQTSSPASSHSLSNPNPADIARNAAQYHTPPSLSNLVSSPEKMSQQRHPDKVDGDLQPSTTSLSNVPLVSANHTISSLQLIPTNETRSIETILSLSTSKDQHLPAIQSNSTTKSVDSSSESSDVLERESSTFEEWGVLGLAKIDLVGFCEGKPWQEWTSGYPGWFEVENERLVDVTAD